MATRCIIGKLNKDKSIDAITCHWDGYPGYVGKILKNYYKDEKTVDKLLKLGALSELNKKLDPDKSSEHSFDNPQKDVTVAYHRDRGEPFYSLKFKNDKELYKELNNPHNDKEYVYLFDNKKWKYLFVNNIPAGWKLLENTQTKLASFKQWLNESNDTKFGLTKVRVVTKKGTYEFDNLADAKKKFPTLDINKNTKDFTWGMKDGDAIRFEDWYTNNLMSN